MSITAPFASRQNLFIFLIVALFFALSGCSKIYEPLPSNARVLAFGDSLTVGVGVSKGQDYPAQLAKMTGWDVVNAGIPGETTEQGLRRFGKLLDKHQPNLVILLEGGNDILRSMSMTKAKSNLNQMIMMAKERQVPLLLIAVPEKKLFSSAAPFYQQLANKHQLLFNKEIVSDLLRDSRYKSDSVHFNQAGYLKLATAILADLSDAGLYQH